MDEWRWMDEWREGGREREEGRADEKMEEREEIKGEKRRGGEITRQVESGSVRDGETRSARDKESTHILGESTYISAPKHTYTHTYPTHAFTHVKSG